MQEAPATRIKLSRSATHADHRRERCNVTRSRRSHRVPHRRLRRGRDIRIAAVVHGHGSEPHGRRGRGRGYGDPARPARRRHEDTACRREGVNHATRRCSGRGRRAGSDLYRRRGLPATRRVGGHDDSRAKTCRQAPQVPGMPPPSLTHIHAPTKYQTPRESAHLGPLPPPNLVARADPRCTCVDASHP